MSLIGCCVILEVMLSSSNAELSLPFKQNMKAHAMSSLDLLFVFWEEWMRRLQGKFGLAWYAFEVAKPETPSVPQISTYPYTIPEEFSFCCQVGI